MNIKQRKQIAEWIDTLDNIKGGIEEMQVEEQDKFDNLPEGLQESEKGEAIQEAAENLEMAVSGLEEVIDVLNEAMLSRNCT